MLRLIPTGGVTVETAGAFLKAGCAALGAGSSLVAKELVQNEDWAGLSARRGDRGGGTQGSREVSCYW